MRESFEYPAKETTPSVKGTPMGVSSWIVPCARQYSFFILSGEMPNWMRKPERTRKNGRSVKKSRSAIATTRSTPCGAQSGLSAIVKLPSPTWCAGLAWRDGRVGGARM